MTKPLLSICIATYNRAQYIGETLLSIIPQLTDETEIIIVDGASTDNTRAVVDEYIQSCRQIHYIQLPCKGGVDQDFCKAVEYAQGEYCWLMSDDDILKPGAVEKVLAEILNNNYSLIIVNAEVRSADLSKMIDTKRLQITKNIIYTPTENEKLFVDMAGYLSFIGCVVIRKQLWMEREREKYFGTAFIHVGVIFQHSLPANTLVIAEPLIVIRYGNAEWTARAFEIWMFKYPNLIWSFTDFSDESKALIIPKEPYLRCSTLLTYRARSAYSIDDYQRFLASKIRSRWTRFVAKNIAEVPGSFLNFLAVLYYSLIYRASRMPLIDIKNSQFYWRRLLKKRNNNANI